MGALTETRGSQYTDEQRKEAATIFAVKGVGSVVSRETGIPETTISLWKKQDWWESLVAEIRSQKSDEHIARYHQLVDLALDRAIEDVGNIDAKAATIVAATATDKARLLLNQPTSISGKAAGVDELAQQFAQLSKQWEEKQVNIVATQEKRDYPKDQNQDQPKPA